MGSIPIAQTPIQEYRRCHARFEELYYPSEYTIGSALPANV